MEPHSSENFSHTSLSLQPDIDRFEMRYRYLLRTTRLLYERGFQLCLTIFMTVIWAMMILMNTHMWYSYLLGGLALTAIWLTFYQYEKLRISMKLVSDADSVVGQMEQREVVLYCLLIARTCTLITCIAILLMSWSMRPSGQMFDPIYVGFISLVSFGVAVTFIQMRKKIRTTRTYLNNIITIMKENQSGS